MWLLSWFLKYFLNFKIIFKVIIQTYSVYYHLSILWYMIKFHKHYFCSIVFWYLIFEKDFIPYSNSTIFLIPPSFGKDMLVETTRLLKHKSTCLLSLSKYHELMAHIHSEWEWYQIIWIERVKGEVRTVLASPPTLCFLHTDK